jgi:hypothetical protein
MIGAADSNGNLILLGFSSVESQFIPVLDGRFQGGLVHWQHHISPTLSTRSNDLNAIKITEFELIKKTIHTKYLRLEYSDDDEVLD